MITGTGGSTLGPTALHKNIPVPPSLQMRKLGPKMTYFKPLIVRSPTVILVADTAHTGVLCRQQSWSSLFELVLQWQPDLQTLLLLGSKIKSLFSVGADLPTVIKSFPLKYVSDFAHCESASHNMSFQVVALNNIHVANHFSAGSQQHLFPCQHFTDIPQESVQCAALPGRARSN